MRYYSIIKEKILPVWYIKNRLRKKFTVLIVGCSTGEEAYNFAILLSEFKLRHKNFDFEIVATDINEDELAIAKKGIYPEESIKDISISFKKKYFLKSKNPEKKLIRVAPEIRYKVKFRKIESFENISFREPMDLIKINRAEFLKLPVLRKMLEFLKADGYLITNGKKNFLLISNLKEVYPLIYKKKLLEN